MQRWRNQPGSWWSSGTLKQVSTAAGVPAPSQPSILHFHPYTDLVIVNGERFVEQVATHTDTQLRIWSVETGDLVLDHTAGLALRDLRVAIVGDPLTPGRFYRAQLRYQSDGGWSPWSDNEISRVSTELSFEPISVPDEPEDGGTCPFVPEFPDEDHRVRPLIEKDLATGHVQRRPAHSKGRRWTTLVWHALDDADKDTLLAFLDARIEANEAFTVDDVAHTGTSWLARRGGREVAQSNLVWTVRIEADEIIRSRAWTVGVTTVGSDDPIRGGP